MSGNLPSLQIYLSPKASIKLLRIIKRQSVDNVLSVPMQYTVMTTVKATTGQGEPSKYIDINTMQENEPVVEAFQPSKLDVS